MNDHTTNKQPPERGESLSDYVARITAGCPCDDCDLWAECARTGLECRRFKDYLRASTKKPKPQRLKEASHDR